MRLLLLLACAAAAAWVSSAPGRAAEAEDGVATVRRCILAASEAHRVPAMVLVILLRVEGGSVGRASPNNNGTSDLGVMQVNTIWVPRMAARWRASATEAYNALRDNICANIEASAWILKQGMDESRDDFWTGVGYYHSHNPEHRARYLRLVLQQALLLQERAKRAASQAPPAQPAPR